MNDAVRAPRDADVVTFFFRPPNLVARPAWEAALDAHPEIFEHAQVKVELKCDAYWVDLSVPEPLYHVDQTRYWFGFTVGGEDDLLVVCIMSTRRGTGSASSRTGG